MTPWTSSRRQIWLLVPIQAKVKEFFADFDQFPYQAGSTLNPAASTTVCLRSKRQ